MKVILVNGSPHEKGCTYTALTEVQKTLEKNKIETEIFWVGNKPISGCLGCGNCIKTGKCFMEDKVNEFLEKVQETDGFVFGTPVHFASGSGMITSFMDRAFYGRRELFKNKLASAVVSCRRGGASAAIDQINKYALMSNMYVVGSSYWNQIHGSNKEEAKDDLEGLQTMRNLGMNIAYLLKCMKNAEQNGIKKPIYEKAIKTNFIR